MVWFVDTGSMESCVNRELVDVIGWVILNSETNTFALTSVSDEVLTVHEYWDWGNWI